MKKDSISETLKQSIYKDGFNDAKQIYQPPEPAQAATQPAAYGYTISELYDKAAELERVKGQLEQVLEDRAHTREQLCICSNERRAAKASEARLLAALKHSADHMKWLIAKGIVMSRGITSEALQKAQAA